MESFVEYLSKISDVEKLKRIRDTCFEDEEYVKGSVDLDAKYTGANISYDALVDRITYLEDHPGEVAKEGERPKEASAPSSASGDVPEDVNSVNLAYTHCITTVPCLDAVLAAFRAANINYKDMADMCRKIGSEFKQGGGPIAETHKVLNDVQMQSALTLVPKEAIPTGPFLLLDAITKSGGSFKKQEGVTYFVRNGAQWDITNDDAVPSSPELYKGLLIAGHKVDFKRCDKLTHATRVFNAYYKREKIGPKYCHWILVNRPERLGGPTLDAMKFVAVLNNHIVDKEDNGSSAMGINELQLMLIQHKDGYAKAIFDHFHPSMDAHVQSRLDTAMTQVSAEKMKEAAKTAAAGRWRNDQKMELINTGNGTWHSDPKVLKSVTTVAGAVRAAMKVAVGVTDKQYQMAVRITDKPGVVAARVASQAYKLGLVNVPVDKACTSTSDVPVQFAKDTVMVDMTMAKQQYKGFTNEDKEDASGLMRVLHYDGSTDHPIVALLFKLDRVASLLDIKAGLAKLTRYRDVRIEKVNGVHNNVLLAIFTTVTAAQRNRVVNVHNVSEAKKLNPPGALRTAYDTKWYVAGYDQTKYVMTEEDPGAFWVGRIRDQLYAMAKMMQKAELLNTAYYVFGFRPPQEAVQLKLFGDNMSYPLTTFMVEDAEFIIPQKKETMSTETVEIEETTDWF